MNRAVNEPTFCQICLKKAILKHKSFNGYQEPNQFQIYHCEECDLAIASPHVNTSELYDHIYKYSNKLPGYYRYSQYFKQIKASSNPIKFLTDKESTYWGVYESLKQKVDDKVKNKILEVGSGLGYLTYALNEDGFNIIGLDISNTAIKKAETEFGPHYLNADIFEYSKKNKESFDFIILTEVIEHVTEPEKFLNALKYILKSTGSIILTTPNKSFYSRKHIWESDNPPVHYWWFSEKSVNLMAMKINMKAEFINFKNYYNKFPTYVSVDKNIEKQGNKPYLDCEGKPLIVINRDKKYNKFFKALGKIKFLKNIYVILKAQKKGGSKLIKCVEKGPVMCAILSKIDPT